MFLMTVMMLLCSLRVSNIFQEPVQFVVKHLTDILSKRILAFCIDGFNLHIYQRQSVALSGFAFFFFFLEVKVFFSVSFLKSAAKI